MATPTYDPIASTTLTSSASSVTFSSLDTIAAGYRDLVLVCNGLGPGLYGLRFNSDSGANYHNVVMRGDGASTASASYSPETYVRTAVGLSTSIPNNAIFQIMDFAATDKHKSVLVRQDRADGITNATASRWANTSAITTLLITTTTTNQYAAGSTFSLYGIAA